MGSPQKTALLCLAFAAAKEDKVLYLDPAWASHTFYTSSSPCESVPYCSHVWSELLIPVHGGKP